MMEWDKLLQKVALTCADHVTYCLNPEKDVEDGNATEASRWCLVTQGKPF